MSLWCLGAYLVMGLLFVFLYWMCLVVGRRHDEEKVHSQTKEPAYGDD